MKPGEMALTLHRSLRDQKDRPHGFPIAQAVHIILAKKQGTPSVAGGQGGESPLDHFLPMNFCD